jgi:hypothetical protein
MPHFKCAACRTRLYSASAPADLVDGLCPRCGSPLEPVGELAEIVGFQSMNPSSRFAREQALRPQEALAQAIALRAPNDNR